MRSENPLELTPDIEWMLQSGQVDESTILEALIYEFRRPFYLLALSYLGDPDTAAQACAAAFSTALLNRYQYRGDGAAAWFYRQALETLRESAHQSEKRIGQTVAAPSSSATNALWQAVSSMPQQHREILLLREVLGLSEQLIGQIVRLDVSEVHSRLDGARRVSAMGDLMVIGFRRKELDESRMTTSLLSLVEDLWPNWERTIPGEEDLYREALGGVQKKGLLRRRFASLKESVFVIAAAAAFVFVLWRVNLWMTEPESISIAAATGTASARAISNVQPRITQSPTRQSPADNYYRDTFPRNAFYLVESRDTLDVIAERLRVTIHELQRLNRLPEGAPLEEGQPLLIPGRVTPHPIPIATSDPYQEAVELPQLPENPTAEEILQRTVGYGFPMEDGIWADFELVLYGGEAYSGPSQHIRIQLWFFSQGPNLLLIGHPDQPETAIMMFQDGLLFAQPGKGSPWFRLLESEEDFALYMNQLLLFQYGFSGAFFSTEGDPGITLSIADRQPYRERDAYVIEATDRQGVILTRYWVDPEIPLPLRVEGFSPTGEHLYETGLRDVAQDIYLPQDLFDAGLPWRGGFARDFTGEPEPYDTPVLLDPREPPARLASITPVEDLDFSGSTLTFQYPESYDLLASMNWGEATERIQVFADGFYLGEIPFFQPFFIRCKRSPTGNRIAYSGHGNGVFFGSPQGFLYLYHLEDRTVETPMEGLVAEFAFSPDGSMLALTGKDGANGNFKVLLYELVTGTLREVFNGVPDTDHRHFLTWSPDSSELALLYSRYGPQGGYLNVMTVWDALTLESVYSDRFESWDTASADWPTKDWGVEFPPYLDTTLMSCAAPPQ